MLTVLLVVAALSAPVTGGVAVDPFAASSMHASPGLPACPPTLARAPLAPDQAETQRELVDVNSASAEQLQSVPGIGATLARRIVEFRTEHGPFEKLDDLLNVQGIGVTSLDKLRPYLTVKPKK